MHNANAKSIHDIYISVLARMSRFLLYLKLESEEIEMLKYTNFLSVSTSGTELLYTQISLTVKYIRNWQSPRAT
jgi:hypothetical protein